MSSYKILVEVAGLEPAQMTLPFRYTSINLSKSTDISTRDFDKLSLITSQCAIKVVATATRVELVSTESKSVVLPLN